MQVRTFLLHMSAQLCSIIRLNTTLVLLARSVDLHEYSEFILQFLIRSQCSSSFVKRVCLLRSIHTAHTVQIRNLLGQRLAFIRLETADSYAIVSTWVRAATSP